jgi:hypothetical protein
MLMRMGEQRMRVLIVRGTGTAAQELAEAVCRGASRFAHVRTRSAVGALPHDLGPGDVIVLTAAAGQRLGPMARLLASLPGSGARAVVVTGWSPGRLLALGQAMVLARGLRRQHVALLLPPRMVRLDGRGHLTGDGWERARELGEDIVVAAGGTIRLERLLPDAV